MRNQISIVIELDKNIDEYEFTKQVINFINSLKLKAEVVGSHFKVLKYDEKPN